MRPKYVREVQVGGDLGEVVAVRIVAATIAEDVLARLEAGAAGACRSFSWDKAVVVFAGECVSCAALEDEAEQAASRSQLIEVELGAQPRREAVRWGKPYARWLLLPRRGFEGLYGTKMPVFVIDVDDTALSCMIMHFHALSFTFMHLHALSCTFMHARQHCEFRRHMIWDDLHAQSCKIIVIKQSQALFCCKNIAQLHEVVLYSA